LSLSTAIVVAARVEPVFPVDAVRAPPG
jgi:hypothetical protein